MQGKGRLLLVFLFSATLTEATGGISVWAEPVTEDLFQAVAQGKNDLLYCSSTAMLQRHEIVALSLPAFITGVGTAIDADGSIGVSLDRPTHIAIADPRRRGLPRSGGGTVQSGMTTEARPANHFRLLS